MSSDSLGHRQAEIQAQHFWFFSRFCLLLERAGERAAWEQMELQREQGKLPWGQGHIWATAAGAEGGAWRVSLRNPQENPFVPWGSVSSPGLVCMGSVGWRGSLHCSPLGPTEP